MIGKVRRGYPGHPSRYSIDRHQSAISNSMRVFQGDIRDTIDLLAFGPGERLAAAAGGRDRLDVWDAVTGSQADAWKAGGLGVGDLGFLPDGRVLASVRDHPLQVIDPDTSARHGIVFPALTAGVHVGPAVRLATVGELVFSTHARNHESGRLTPPTLACWKPTPAGRYTPAWSLPVGSAPLAVATSPDGRFVATAELVYDNTRDQETITLRDPATGAEIRRVTANVRPWAVRDRLRFSPDGSRVFAARDGAVGRWDTATGDHLGWIPVADPGAAPTDVAVHPSGRWLLTPGLDGRVRVWDAEYLTETTAFQWGVGKLRSVAIGADGTIAAAGGEDGKIVVWDLDL